MTIHQLKDPCWVLRPPADEERDPHYDTRAEALKDIRDKERDDAEWWAGRSPWRLRLKWLHRMAARLRPGGPTPRQIAARCWVLQDDGECGQVFDEEDEGYVVHCKTRQAAEDLARSWEWTYSADGRFIYCPCGEPEGTESIPPSPAEQEAAGQLAIPGVLP